MAAVRTCCPPLPVLCYCGAPPAASPCMQGRERLALSNDLPGALGSLQPATPPRGGSVGPSAASSLNSPKSQPHVWKKELFSFGKRRERGRALLLLGILFDHLNVKEK